MATVAELLAGASSRFSGTGIESARLDAELLLARALGWTRAALLARRGEPVPEPAAATFHSLVARRLDRVPVAYLLGVKEFWSLEFEVDGSVLIPRADTEWVVTETLGILEHRRGGRPPVVADVGTGAGPIAVSIAVERPDVVVQAIDLSPAALAVARRNAARHGVADTIRFHEGDLLLPLLGGVLEGRLDVVASNPPYVGLSEAVDPEVIRWEPGLAVFGGATGAEVIERLIPQAARALAPGGALVMEVTQGRLEHVRDLLARGGGWSEPAIRDDYAGWPRVMTVRREMP